jgi:hypothetical protein
MIMTEQFWIKIFGDMMLPRFHPGTLIYMEPDDQIIAEPKELEALRTRAEPLTYGTARGEQETAPDSLVFLRALEESDRRCYFGALIEIDKDSTYIIKQDNNPNAIELPACDWSR